MSGAVIESAELFTGQKLFNDGLAIKAGQQIIEGAAIQSLNVSAALGGNGNGNRLVKQIVGMADAADVLLFTITIPNALSAAGIRVCLTGMLGDGDSAETSLYDLAISRIAGANALCVASAKNAIAATVGVAGNCVSILTVPAVAGAIGASNTFAVTARVTRSAGASTNHKITAIVELLSQIGGITIS